MSALKIWTIFATTVLLGSHHPMALSIRSSSKSFSAPHTKMRLWMAADAPTFNPFSSLAPLFNDEKSKSASRELIGRTYAAQKDLFLREAGLEIYTAESLKSGSEEESTSSKQAWLYRLFLAVVSFFTFPFIVSLIRPFANSEDVTEVVDGVLPGVGILFGTLIALTYQILFDRQSRLEDLVTKEVACLATIASELEYLFTNDTPQRREAFRCVWKHASTLIYSSRIDELIDIMNFKDPLVQLLDVVNKYTFSLDTLDFEREWDLQDRKSQLQATFIPSLRDGIQEMIELRSSRLHSESTGLPSTHFLILTLLAVSQVLFFSSLYIQRRCPCHTPALCILNRIPSFSPPIFALLPGHFLVRHVSLVVAFIS